MSTSYEDLAARAERGELQVKPGTVLRGAAAADAARRSLLEATGATSNEELIRIVVGHPLPSSEHGG